MIVYHGTDSDSAQNILKDGINLKCGNPSVDNGQGFYTTPSKLFALRRAKIMTLKVCGFRSERESIPVVLEIAIDETAFDALNVLEIPDCTDQWKEFVLYNRLGKRFLRDQKIESTNHNLDFKFDLVMDETADAGVGDIVSEIRYQETRRKYDLQAAINKIHKSNSKVWGKQISFHTKRALQCIKSIKVIEE